MSSRKDAELYPDKVTVLIEIHAKPGQEDVARKALVTNIETSEKPGLLSFVVYSDNKDPSAFYSTQEWESMACFHDHMNAAKSGLAEATSMLREPPRTCILHQISRGTWPASIRA
jgi:quinol monooxygenase YgiN